MLRVFIVEDSAIVRERLRTLLEGIAGVVVVGEAGEVAGAVTAIPQLRPDLITIDLQLWDGVGMEALAKVKRAECGARVIVLTNHDFPQYRRRCLDCGADYFFDKSTEMNRVAEVTRELIGK